MANQNPIVTVVGEVRGINERIVTDPETGEVKDKLSVTVLTRVGFIDVVIPVTKRPFDRQEGDLVILEVAVLSWAFKGRTGTSFILDEDLTALGGLRVPAELAGSKK